MAASIVPILAASQVIHSSSRGSSSGGSSSGDDDLEGCVAVAVLILTLVAVVFAVGLLLSI